MSQRGKRPNQRPENDGGPPVKRRKGRPPGSISKNHSTAAVDDDNSGFGSHQNNSNNGAAIASTSKSWQPKPHSDLKSIYNRSAPEAPAELFRKDLISAMKLPDSEPLAPDEYWLIVDQWKQEWERGVQVPVNPDSLPEASVNNIKENYIQRGRQDFKLPKNKYIRITKDESFSHEQHYLTHTPAMAEAVCAYDLDQCDEAWIKICNGERALSGLPPITEKQFEKVIEELELRCWEKIQAIMKNEEGLGIEYDENVICDVCRSPDSEEANEMVFCDSCNICVHQACYGITAIPSGQWLCRTCSMGKKPDCVLCPNKGGAMKSTRSGTKWAHVSCALWIPEVSIGSVDRMEPITKISNIPSSRWALNCILCRERVGACIQCSVKTCKTAYHVTCAFQHGLEMRAIIEDEHNEDGVKLRSYCLKHSNTKSKKEGTSGNNKTSTTSTGSGTDDDDNKKRRTRKEMTSEERNQIRAQKLAEIESEFDKHVNIKDISCHLLDIDQEGINYIYNYWILKRKSGNNRPLLPPKNEDTELASQKEENQEHEKMRMFVQLRQDLERVRNLCYMVSRREKLSRSYFKLREQTFHKQIGVLADIKHIKKLDDSVINAVIEANHGPSIYDKLYSSDSVKHNDSELVNNIDVILDRLTSSNSSSSNRHKSPKQGIDLGSNSSLDKINLSPHKSRQSVDINGINNNNKKNLSSKSSTASGTASIAKQDARHHSDNPYKRTYFNGTATSRRSASLYSSTGLSSNRSASSSEDESHKQSSNKSATPITANSGIASNKSHSNKASPRQRSQSTKTAERKRRRDVKIELPSKIKSASIIDSSSEDEENQRISRRSPRNRTLQQMEQELFAEANSTDSDELTGICIKPNSYSSTKVSTAIYSDSDSTDKDKTDNTASDSQQHPFRTKAAMKEFNLNASSTEKPSKNVPNPIISPVKTNRVTPKGILKNNEKVPANTIPLKSPLMTPKEEEKVKTVQKKLGKSNKSDFSVDLLVVPQRQAAKKASENLMKTNVPPSSTAITVQQQISTLSTNSKKENKSEFDINERTRLSVDDQISEKKLDKKLNSQKTQSRGLKRQESRDALSDREKEKKDSSSNNSNKKDDSSHIDLLPYVPQRQAAKKAAEHIKTAVLKPSEAVAPIPVEPPKPVLKPTKSSIKKDETPKKSLSESSSSGTDSTSSSGSSSDSDSKTSSSSSEDSEPEPQKVSQKRQSTASKSSTSRNSKAIDKTKDLPFLDKGNKSTGDVSYTSDSDTESGSSSNESNVSIKREPAKITKRKSSSAATNTSLKSSSSGVGTSASTNISSRPGRPRGRPKVKLTGTKEANVKLPKAINRTSSGTSKESHHTSSTTTTPNKKDETNSRRQSTTSTPSKTTTRGRRDSKVQSCENAVSSIKRRTSGSSPRITSEVVDVKSRRKSISTRRESIKDAVKSQTHSTSNENVSAIDKKSTEDSRANDNTPTVAARKRRLSAESREEKSPQYEHSGKEKKNIEQFRHRTTDENKTNKANDQTRVLTPTERQKDKTILESVELMKRKTPVHDAQTRLPVTTNAVDVKNVSEHEILDVRNEKDVEETKDIVLEGVPRKIPSPIKKHPTRSSSDMEIEPPLSPRVTFYPDENLKPPASISGITSNTLSQTVAKNNGPKSIFDIADDLSDTHEPHFEVPQTPLAFTSHHNDWLKSDGIEDEQATFDLVEKLRQNKHKKQTQSSESQSLDVMDDELKESTLDDTASMDYNSKKQSEVDKTVEKEGSQSTKIELNKHNENDALFSTEIATDKKNSCKETGQNQNKTYQQDIFPSCAVQKPILSQVTSSQSIFSQDQFIYGRRWNEAEIIARRRSVSSSPASTVSDNNETQQHQKHKQEQLQKEQSLEEHGTQVQKEKVCQNIPNLSQSSQQQQSTLQSHLQLNQQSQSHDIMQITGIKSSFVNQKNPTMLPQNQSQVQMPIQSHMPPQFSPNQLQMQLQHHHPAQSEQSQVHGQMQKPNVQPSLQTNSSGTGFSSGQLQQMPQHQMQPHQQNRSYKQDAYMPSLFQSTSKPATGLQSSPPYSVGARAMMYQNRVAVGNRAEEIKSLNMQAFRPPNPTALVPPNEHNIPLAASMGSPQIKSPAHLVENRSNISQSPQIAQEQSIMTSSQSSQISQTPITQQPLTQMQQPIVTDTSNLYGSMQSHNDHKNKLSTVSLAELKGSPAKANRTNRNYQQNIENMQTQVRSPLATKSPGKSPRQMDLISKQVHGNSNNKNNNSKTANEGNAKQRSRSNSTKNAGQTNRNRNGGNKKGRGKNILTFNEFDFGGTNHSNLAGTAYDLDLVEEENNFTLENFRTSLRDRKKSNDTSTLDYLRSREPSHSPKFSSPKNRSLYSSAANTPTTASSDTTQLHHPHHPLMTPEVTASSVNAMPPAAVTTSLHDMVLPVLPGPVDMRTYNTSYDTSTNNEMFNNHLLGAFDSGTADHTLADIDEEMEKELQSALKASSTKPTPPTTATNDKSHEITTKASTNANITTNAVQSVLSGISLQSSQLSEPLNTEDLSIDSDTIKVSLPDSRNQLKLKIKGPLAPDSYSSSLTIQKTVETNVSITTIPTPAPGLRRMRKKELLRQYWTQDANLDDHTNISTGDTNLNIPSHSLPNRVSGIPKAVDSMSSIPTKEDYKDYNTTDTKKRKKVPNLQRELRQLSGSMEEDIIERRRSIGNASDKSSNASTSGRSRMNRTAPVTGQTPKLKIKIGSDIIEPTGVTNDEPRQSDKPPKKRLDNIVSYSMEDLKRDSLNFRKQMFADFGKKQKLQDRAEKAIGKEKKKKKKEKKRKVEVIENNQKFVLKIKKPKIDDPQNVLKPEPASMFDPNAVDPLAIDAKASKSAPIKLKIARTSGADGGYTLSSKKEKSSASKKSTKKLTSNDTKKSDDSQPLKKRELNQFRLQIQKLDQDMIRKLSSNPGKIDSIDHKTDVQANDISITEKDPSATLTKPEMLSEKSVENLDNPKNQELTVNLERTIDASLQSIPQEQNNKDSDVR